MYLCIFVYMCMSVHYMHVIFSEAGREHWVPWDWVPEGCRCYIGAGNQTQVLCKGSKHADH